MSAEPGVASFPPEVTAEPVPRPNFAPPGTAAGIELADLAARPSAPGRVQVTVIDYCTEQVHCEDVSDLAEFLGRHRPAWSKVRWINVRGLGDMHVIQRLAEKYELHPLEVEDLLHDHRPKCEDFPEAESQLPRLFVIAWTLTPVGRCFRNRQVSMSLGRQTLLTFQPEGPDGFDPIRQRLQTKGSRLRRHDASFLFYSILDTLVDHYFPLLERISRRLEKLQREVLAAPTQSALRRLHRLRGQLVLLRRSAWGIRDVVQMLYRESHPCLAEDTRHYFRDLYDHVMHICDFIETYRELLSACTETYMNSVSNRLNDVMKALAIITTIFVPLSFLTGVYGMNLQIPEAHAPWMYPLFWCICLTVTAGMLLFFRRRKWL